MARSPATRTAEPNTLPFPPRPWARLAPLEESVSENRLTRRALLTAGVATLGALGATRLTPAPVTQGPRLLAAPGATATTQVHLAATDGWVSMPVGSPALPPFWPDPAA